MSPLGNNCLVMIADFQVCFEEFRKKKVCSKKFQIDDSSFEIIFTISSFNTICGKLLSTDSSYKGCKCSIRFKAAVGRAEIGSDGFVGSDAFDLLYYFSSNNSLMITATQIYLFVLIILQ